MNGEKAQKYLRVETDWKLHLNTQWQLETETGYCVANTMTTFTITTGNPSTESCIACVLCKSRLDIDTVSLEGTFCDIVQVPSGAADMQLI